MAGILADKPGGMKDLEKTQKRKPQARRQRMKDGTKTNEACGWNDATLRYKFGVEMG
jgi:hypothetical protein